MYKMKKSLISDYSLVAGLVIYSLVTIILQLFFFLDANSIKYVAIDKSVYQNDWENILSIDNGEEEKPVSSSMKNLTDSIENWRGKPTCLIDEKPYNSNGRQKRTTKKTKYEKLF